MNMSKNYTGTLDNLLENPDFYEGLDLKTLKQKNAFGLSDNELKALGLNETKIQTIRALQSNLLQDKNLNADLEKSSQKSGNASIQNSNRF